MKSLGGVKLNLAYYIFLLLIIFLLIIIIVKNEKLSPIRIKVYLFAVLILFLFRYIGLFLLCVVKGGTFIYYFKSILYLNHLAIPLIVLALAYVYLRWDTLSFRINYFIATLLGLVYFIGMFFINGRVLFDVKYGYIINIQNEESLFLVSLFIVGGLLIFCIHFLDKPNNNRKGMCYLILALAVVIIENVIYLGGIRIFPYPIIGDGIFLILMNLCINKFSNSKFKIKNSK